MTEVKTFDKKGELHSYDDLPAYSNENSQVWYKHGEMHRGNDLPACSFPMIDTYEWRVNGLRHREGNQPAVIKNGKAIFYGIFGEPHNENGPAYDTLPDVYFLYGLPLTLEEFTTIMDRNKSNDFSLPILTLGSIYGIKDEILRTMITLPFTWANKLALLHTTDEEKIERNTGCLNLAWVSANRSFSIKMLTNKLP